MRHAAATPNANDAADPSRAPDTTQGAVSAAVSRGAPLIGQCRPPPPPPPLPAPGCRLPGLACGPCHPALGAHCGCGATAWCAPRDRWRPTCAPPTSASRPWTSTSRTNTWLRRTWRCLTASPPASTPRAWPRKLWRCAASAKTSTRPASPSRTACSVSAVALHDVLKVHVPQASFAHPPSFDVPPPNLQHTHTHTHSCTTHTRARTTTLDHFRSHASRLRGALAAPT